MARAAQGRSTERFHAVFSSAKSQYTVTIAEAGHITWLKKSVKEESRKVLQGEDILAIDVINKGDTDLTTGFKLIYVKYKKKNILRQAHKKFYGTSETCQLMITTVQELIKAAPLRPRKALVLINPFCGRQSGINIYETQVAPIFKSCGLQTDVVVMERSREWKEMLSGYHWNGIDCIVLFGGDGSYHLLVNCLLPRIQNEAGMDLNDPDAPLKEFAIPIGLIPGGTGNSVANVCYGTQDVETAVLRIIKGRKRKANVFSVFADERFLSSAVFLVGYGLMADLIPRTEQLRHFGPMRYFVGAFENYVLRQRILNVTIEYLKPSDGEEQPCFGSLGLATFHRTVPSKNVQNESRDAKEENSRRGDDTPGVAAAEQMVEGTDSSAPCGSPESNLLSQDNQSDNTSSTSPPLLAWQSEQKELVCLTGFAHDIYGAALGKATSEDTAGVLINRPCTRWQSLQFMYRDRTLNKNLLGDGVAEHVTCRGYRVTLNQTRDTETDTSSNHLNLDGELYHFRGPQYEVRLHTGIVELICGTESVCEFEKVWSPFKSRNNDTETLDLQKKTTNAHE